MIIKRWKAPMIAVAMLVAVSAMLAGVRVSQANDSSAAEMIASGLSAQGITGASVGTGAVDASVRIVLQGKASGDPATAWAETVADREAAFQMGAGVMPIGPVRVAIVDENGSVLVESLTQGHPLMRSAPKVVDTLALEAVKASLDQQGQKIGSRLSSLTLRNDEYQGTVVEASVEIAEGTTRDEQMRWSTVGLLSQVRGFADGPANLGVSLYRSTIRNLKGATLVDYVVDAETGYVRAWCAPGVAPVWSLMRPVAETSSPSTTP